MSLIKFNSTFKQLTDSHHIGVVKRPYEQDGFLRAQYAPTFGTEIAILIDDELVEVTSFTVHQELFHTPTIQFTTPNIRDNTSVFSATDEFDFILYIRPQDKS